MEKSEVHVSRLGMYGQVILNPPGVTFYTVSCDSFKAASQEYRNHTIEINFL